MEWSIGPAAPVRPSVRKTTTASLRTRDPGRTVGPPRTTAPRTTTEGTRTMSMATPLGPKAHTGSAGGAVALCGVGAVTGYGWGHKLLVEGLLSGETALRPTP